MSEQLLSPLLTLALQEGRQSFGGSDIPDELLAHHFASSMLRLIQWWLENDCPYPEDVMVIYINRLLIQPLIDLKYK